MHRRKGVSGIEGTGRRDCNNSLHEAGIDGRHDFVKLLTAHQYRVTILLRCSDLSLPSSTASDSCVLPYVARMTVCSAIVRDKVFDG